MQALSKKGVLFLTAGFMQSYALQNIASILDQDKYSNRKVLKIILFDGEVYISGVYHAKNKQDQKRIESIKQFDIVKIQGRYEGASRPIMIDCLQIMSSDHKGLYGSVPISIIDYLERKMTRQDSERKMKENMTRQDQSRFNQNQTQIFLKSYQQQMIHEDFQRVELRNDWQQRNQHFNDELRQKQNRNESQKQNNLDDNDEVMVAVIKHNQDKKIKTNQPQRQQNNQEKNVQSDMKRRDRADLTEIDNSQRRKQLKMNEDSMTIKQHKNEKIQKDQTRTYQNQEKERNQRWIPPPMEIQSNLSCNNQYLQDQDTQQKNCLVGSRQKTQQNNFEKAETQKNSTLDNFKSSRKIMNNNQVQMMHQIFDSQDKKENSNQLQNGQIHANGQEKIIHQERVQNNVNELDNYCSSNAPSVISKNKTYDPYLNSINLDSEEQPLDTCTKPKSQTQVLENPQFSFCIESTPPKPSHLPQPKIMGTTTQRKHLQQQYNLLISNLYEDNNSFKIICRVNHMYEWISKKGVACLGLSLIDAEGSQIKAIVYMNHPQAECQDCRSIIQVGKVYCFQNGQCKRDRDQKEKLQLIFNLKTNRPYTSYTQSNNYNTNKKIISISTANKEKCSGKSRIISTNKILIEPLQYHKIYNITKAIEMFQSGKTAQITTFGILETFKISEFQKRTETIPQPAQQILSSDQVIILDKQPEPQKNSPSQQTKIYINGYIADPIEQKKICFSAVMKKQSANQTAEQFLGKNGLIKGSLIVLHHVKVSSINNNTVKKLERTKRTYLQVITYPQQEQTMMSKPSKSQDNFQLSQFACQSISLNCLPQGPLKQTFFQLLSYPQQQLQKLFSNPRFLNLSLQPYTARTIIQMNQLLQNCIMVEESCYSSLKDVKIYQVIEKKQVEICTLCRKKVKVNEPNSNHALSNARLNRYCQKCKTYVGTTRIHVFILVFADCSASFMVQVAKESFLQTILDMKLSEYLAMSQPERQHHLAKIKYDAFTMTVKSEKKIGGTIHKVMGIQNQSTKPRISDIKEERKGEKKHYQRLQASW